VTRVELFQYDAQALLWLNSHPIPYSVPFFQFVSATTTYASIGMAAVLLILALVKRKKIAWKRFLSVVMVLVSVGLVSQGMKSLINRERPYIDYPVIVKLSDGGGSSFPSGHTMEAFAMAMALSLAFRRRWVVVVLFVWAALVAYSRMLLGVHYPLDVAGGMIIGLMIGGLIRIPPRQGDGPCQGDGPRQGDGPCQGDGPRQGAMFFTIIISAAMLTAISAGV
jgi:undecaprenyl-diphosphatase